MHVNRREIKPVPANGRPPLYSANERFQQEVGDHAAAIMLWFAYYNFCRIHKSLRVTPAIEAGITDHVWDLAELLG